MKCDGNVYRVIKAEGGQFWIDKDGKAHKCKARGKLKKDSVMVGDFVTLDYVKDIATNGQNDEIEQIIQSVVKRKNRLVRPSVANIDQIIIMAAATPEVDYLLLDKLIINAGLDGIEAIICYNKSDINTDSFDKIYQDYHKSVRKIIKCSALCGEIDGILEMLSGKLTCIAGQSAVGKSSIINVLLGKDYQKTGVLSERISRGKNTTTSSEIFKVAGGYVVDTPGFSIVDIYSIRPEEINQYYQEFDEFRDECKFSTCTHTFEPKCGVRDAAQKGQISLNRYQRYLKIYAECKAAFDRRF